MIIEVKPDSPKHLGVSHFGIFLAGSIEMGKAKPWASDLVKKVEKKIKTDSTIVFYNPRRNNWDSSWKQDIKNKNFKDQVEWELRQLEVADTVVFYFQPDTISAVSLLELGMQINSKKKVIVYCPKGYHKKGNIDVVCERYGFQQVKSMKELIDVIVERIDKIITIQLPKKGIFKD